MAKATATTTAAQTATLGTTKARTTREIATNTAGASTQYAGEPSVERHGCCGVQGGAAEVSTMARTVNGRATSTDISDSGTRRDHDPRSGTT